MWLRMKSFNIMEAHGKVRSLERVRVIAEKEGLEEFADLKEGLAKKGEVRFLRKEG